jgi:hypothetical protein
MTSMSSRVLPSSRRGVAVTDDSSLHEKPSEFMSALKDHRGYCDAQSVLPEDDHYVCHCTCGGWDITAATREEGLALARAHTASTAA